MKDYRLPAAVTIPAAIGLVGVLWFLRHKSSTNGKGGKGTHKVSSKDKERTLEWTSQAQDDQQTQDMGIEAITVSQRKVPETLARDRGSSDLKCSELNDLTQAVVSGQNVIVQELGMKQNISEHKANMNFCKVNNNKPTSHTGQGKCVTLVDLSHADEGNSVSVSNVSQINQGNSVTISDVSEISQGNTAIPNVSRFGQDSCVSSDAHYTNQNKSATSNIPQVDHGNDVKSEDFEHIKHGNSLIVKGISETNQDNIVASDICHTVQSDTVTSANITAGGQHERATSVNQIHQNESHCSCVKGNDLSPDNIQFNRSDVMSCITQGDQGENLLVSQICQIDTLQTPYIHGSGQVDGLLASQVCHGDTPQPPNVHESGQCDGLTLSQIVYIEQQVITAMRDGLKETQKLLSEAVSSSDQEDMLSDSGILERIPEAEQSTGSTVMEEFLAKKTPTSQLETAELLIKTNPEIDLKIQVQTNELQAEKMTVEPQSISNDSFEISTAMVKSSSSTTLEINDDISSSKIDSPISVHEVVKPSPDEASSSPSLLSSDSLSMKKSQSHIETHSQIMKNPSPTKNWEMEDHENRIYDISEKTLETTTGLINADTSDTSFETTEKTVSKNIKTSVSSLKQVSNEPEMDIPPAGSWLPNASTSSIDSFGPEEIEAIWGIKSSFDNLDLELCFTDTDPVAVPSESNSLLEQKSPCDLDSRMDNSALSSMLLEDNASSSREGQSSAAVPFSDKGLKDVSQAKPESPMCDNNSEGSNDSGRGGSEHDMLCQGAEALVHFDFNIPSELCGHFIGKQGKNINYLKSKSGAHVSLTNNPYTPEYQVCQIVGTQAEVDDALGMIRRKFPLQDYPHLTMVPINMSVPLPLQPDSQLVYPEAMQLSLPEGVSVEVFVSTVVDAGQVFIQQPTHRSFMSLEKLNYFLNLVYVQDPNVPSIPLPVESGIICVCESEGFWYRAMIMTTEDENGEVQVKFVDYGGYVSVPVYALKQIRADFMTLPFQAVECFMANITPNQDEKFFSSEATQALSEMTQGKLLQCQVVARTEYGIPYIHLYQINSETNSAVLINRALVNNRLVRWIEIL